jgi:hypothetical protein
MASPYIDLETVWYMQPEFQDGGCILPALDDVLTVKDYQ